MVRQRKLALMILVILCFQASYNIVHAESFSNIVPLHLSENGIVQISFLNSQAKVKTENPKPKF